MFRRASGQVRIIADASANVGGDLNHKIVKYDTALVGNPWKNWLFLRLETDTGTQGFAEASLNGFVKSVATAVSELENYFINRSPFDINKIVQDMLYGIYSDGGQIHRAAIASVESACLDIVGKTLDQPVWNIWGGKVRDEVRLYANGWYQAERDPEVLAQKARSEMALLRRESAVRSADAAAALGILAGAPTPLNVTALRREESAAPEESFEAENSGDAAATLASPAPVTATARAPAPTASTATSRHLALAPLSFAGFTALYSTPASASVSKRAHCDPL